MNKVSNTDILKEMEISVETKVTPYHHIPYDK
jgi:hypothetical protein